MRVAGSHLDSTLMFFIPTPASASLHQVSADSILLSEWYTVYCFGTPSTIVVCLMKPMMGETLY